MSAVTSDFSRAVGEAMKTFRELAEALGLEAPRKGPVWGWMRWISAAYKREIKCECGAIYLISLDRRQSLRNEDPLENARVFRCSDCKKLSVVGLAMHALVRPDDSEQEQLEAVVKEHGVPVVDLLDKYQVAGTGAKEHPSITRNR